MTAEEIGQLVQRIQRGESVPFSELVAGTSLDVRLFVATYVPTTALVEQITKEIYAVVKREITRCPASAEAMSWIIQTAHVLLTAKINDSGYQATMARDPLVDMVSQEGIVSLAQNLKCENEAANRLPRQIQFQPPSLQLLLKRHYGEDMSIANLAEAQGLGEDDIAQSLVSARARLDWSGTAGVIDTADYTFPKLIEDYMAGSITPEARALLVASVIQDESRSVQFIRQMRMHIWLSVFFTPYNEDTVRALIQSLPARDDSSRLNPAAARPITGRIGKTGRPSSGPRPVGTETARVRRNTTEVRSPTRAYRKTDQLADASAAAGGPVSPTDASGTIPLKDKLRKNLPIVISSVVIAIVFIASIVAYAVSGDGNTPAVAGTENPTDPNAPPVGDFRYGLIHLVEGDGAVMRQGVQLPATPGDAIAPGDAFATKTNGKIATLIGDQVRLTLGSETIVSAINKTDKTITSEMKQGRLGSDIRTGPTIQSLIVKTPHGSVEQINAGCLVEVVQGATRVQVTRGTVTVKGVTGGGAIEAKAGAVVLIREGVDPAEQGGGVFARGVNFGEGSVNIEGNQWLSLREAEGAGLQILDGSEIGESLLISGQGLDFDSKRMFDFGLINNSGPVKIKQVLPNGDYNLAMWFAGNAEASWNDLSLTINNEKVALGPPAEKTERWRRLGPFRFTVTDKQLELTIGGLNHTHVAGLALSAAGELAGSLPPMAVITAPEVDFAGAVAELPIYTRTDIPDKVEKISYYNGDTLLGEATKPPYNFVWKNPPPGEFSLTAVVTTIDGEANRSAPVPGAIQDIGSVEGILREVWKNVNGQSISELKKHKAYIDGKPDNYGFFGSINNTPQGGNYGARYRGYVLPPDDGNYVFQISSDDSSELWLSPDESPEKRVRICSIDGHVGKNDFDKLPSQTSQGIPLKRGERYYIEALFKQAGGSAHITVGWIRPGNKQQRPIPKVHLRPVAPDFITPPPLSSPSTPTPGVATGKPIPIPPVADLKIPDAPAGAFLQGKAEKKTGIINLSIEANSDWIAYGEDSATVHNRKSDGDNIISVVQSQGSEIKRYGDSQHRIAWFGGTPKLMKPVSQGGIFVSGKSKGLTFTAPADPVLRELKVYVGIQDTKGTITASISDNSLRPHIETIDSPKGRQYREVTFLYRSEIPGQTLTVAIEGPSANAGGNLLLDAVALNEYSDGARRFVMGVNLEGPDVVVDGNKWHGQKEASAFGLSVKNDRRVTLNIEPKPAVDADTKKMLGTGIAAKGGELEIYQKLANGRYEVTVYMLETVVTNAHLFDVKINNAILTDIGKLTKGSWAAYGPAAVTVDSGLLSIISVDKKGTPQLMGYSIHAPARVTGPRTNAFPNGQPHPVPGVIYAANFDLGWESQAFHDNKEGNEGKMYRPGSVDIAEHEGIPIIGYTENGEWLRYTISVAEAGTYEVKINQARQSNVNPTNDVFMIEIDGKPAGKPGPMEKTADWYTFTDVSLGTVQLEPGIHDVRLLFGSAANTKTITFTKTN